MTQMSNTIDLVREVVRDLSEAGFQVAVFGGWAEELLEAAPSRSHSDIDLLVFDPDLELLDAFVAGREKIAEKHSSHKRAFIAATVMVELFLVHEGTTAFWDGPPYRWPTVELVNVRGLPVAPQEYLAAYRRDFATIRAAWLG
jgi:hypothetical protein